MTLAKFPFPKFEIINDIMMSNDNNNNGNGNGMGSNEDRFYYHLNSVQNNKYPNQYPPTSNATSPTRSAPYDSRPLSPSFASSPFPLQSRPYLYPNDPEYETPRNNNDTNDNISNNNNNEDRSQSPSKRINYNLNDILANQYDPNDANNNTNNNNRLTYTSPYPFTYYVPVPSTGPKVTVKKHFRPASAGSIRSGPRRGSYKKVTPYV